MNNNTDNTNNLEKKITLENVGYVIKNGKFYSNYKQLFRNRGKK